MYDCSEASGIIEEKLYFYSNPLVMQPKSFLLFIFSASLIVTATAQKPIRKGMPPVTVIKPKPRSFYTLEQLCGKWQEIKRTPVYSKDAISFTDTLLMQFDSDKVEIKDAISMRMTMKGTAEIEPPYNLVAAGDEYIIKFLDKNKMILDDGENLKELHKKEIFYFETLGKLTIPMDSLNIPINIDTKKLEGKWIVYRRQALAGSVDDDAVVIKSLDVFPSNTIGSALGQVVCYKSDVSESLPCKIVYGDANILVITDKYVWEFSTYKANGNEFVFGEAGRLLYYAKH